MSSLARASLVAALAVVLSAAQPPSAPSADAPVDAAPSAKARAARGPAHVSVDAKGDGWRSGARVQVRVDGARVDTAKPLDIAKSFITVEVDDGNQKSRRVASLFPGVHYVVRGNPCAQWTLQATDDLAATRSKDASGATTLRVDASSLASKWFPIAVTLDESPTATLDAPASTAALDVIESAMCMGAGVRLRVVSRASKKPLFDAVVIAHEGDASTMRIDAPHRWTLAVDP